MKAGLFSVASVTLLQLVVARAALHQNHQHLHDKRAPAVVTETVTDSEYVYYDAVDVIVYKDANGKPLSTVTKWKGEKHAATPPPPPPTTTSTPPPPPPPASSSSSAPPPPPSPAAEEKLAQPVHHQPHNAPAPSAPAQSSAPAPKPSSSSSGGGGGGAKGIAYNTPAQANQISDISWACNWGQTAGASLPNNAEFVPQLWGKKDGMCDSFANNVQSQGAKHALFYNEPDMPQSVGGSGIDVGTAISDFGTYMVPLKKSGVAISTPCVANSDISYLEQFLGGVNSADVDILCFHWYGPDIGGLQSTVESFQSLADQHGIKELWINEWAVQPAPNDLSSFTSYLDSKVARYAYNMNDMEGSTGY